MSKKVLSWGNVVESPQKMQIKGTGDYPNNSSFFYVENTLNEGSLVFDYINGNIVGVVENITGENILVKFTKE